jgi:hypothetical protein
MKLRTIIQEQKIHEKCNIIYKQENNSFIVNIYKNFPK